MDYLEYKGYKGSIEYSKEDDCLFGKVQGLGKNVLILYEGNTVDELRKDFEGGIDSYLEGCKERVLLPRNLIVIQMSRSFKALNVAGKIYLW